MVRKLQKSMIVGTSSKMTSFTHTSISTRVEFVSYFRIRPNMIGIRAMRFNSLTIEVLVSRWQDKLKGIFTDQPYVMKTLIVTEKFQKWKSQVLKFINMNLQSLLGKNYLLNW